MIKVSISGIVVSLKTDLRFLIPGQQGHGHRIIQFIDEIPYWTAEKHGKKYRIMYQVYTHPKYREYGMKFFEGVGERYTEYAKSLEGKLGIPYEKLTPLIFILVRACVHYALFENEFYMKSQIEVLKETLGLFNEKYNINRRKIQ